MLNVGHLTDEVEEVTRPLLKYGSQGPDVVLLQQALNQEPSAKAKLTDDGIFGSKTHGRVFEFQSKKGLMPDGIVGNQTHGALEQVYELIQKLVLQTPPEEEGARKRIRNVARMAAAMMGWPPNLEPPDANSQRIAARHGLGTPVNAKGDQLRQGGTALATIYATAGHPFAQHCFTIPEEHIEFFRNTVKPPPAEKNKRLPDWCGIFCLYVYKTCGLKMSAWPLRILTSNPEMKAVTRLQDVKRGDLCMVEPFGGRNHHFLIADFDGQTIHSVDGNAGKHATILQRTYSIHKSTPDKQGAFSLNTPLGQERAMFATPLWDKVL